MGKIRGIRGLILAAALGMTLINPTVADVNVFAAEQSGQVSAGVSNLNFREQPGGNYIKDENGANIRLQGGQKLTIEDTSNATWYKVSLDYKGKNYVGYVHSDYVTIYSDEPATEGSSSEEAEDEEVSTEELLSEDDFEEYLTEQGFPDSYKPYLRKLHDKYPTWRFEAVNTGIDWNTLVENEKNKKGQVKNLVWTSSVLPHYNWRSTSVGYSWAKDTWSAFDGSNWFAASDDLVSYYLDPRTYLYENYIFVFESLSYQKGLHTEKGVEAILKGTFMYKKVPAGETKTYAKIIMSAAKKTGVSPYHIASRIVQEVGANGCPQAFGTNSVAPGIYNFFNIGAVDSADGSAATKGVIWASMPGSFGRPWNSVSKAITGGAQYVGTSYISVGQDTLYTQKFNVTNKNSLFSHQYMTNVQAPSSECIKAYNAYANNNLLKSTMVFKIPVYKNMPKKALSKPADSGNPNNWLKSLSVDGYTLTPKFAVNKTTKYSLTVPKHVKSVKISAKPVNSAAKISGTGTVKLAKGTNTVKIRVTAQNGTRRTYKLTIVRGKASTVEKAVENEQVETPNTAGTEVSESTSNTSETILGDLNEDGKITAIDIVKLQRIITGADKADDALKAVADVNKDGKISALDIVCIQRHIVGIQSLI